MKMVGKGLSLVICLLSTLWLTPGVSAENVVWSEKTSSDNPFGPNPSELSQRLRSEPRPELLNPSELDSVLQALMETHHVPGAQACIIHGDSIVWEGCYGFMDPGLSDPVNSSTLFIVASISKTVLATAVMQCWEDGLIELDADISDYLPFTVENVPYYPGSPITIRMVLSHVSSINRNDWTWFYDIVYGSDWPGDLGQYMEDYIVPGGPTYADSNFIDVVPGTHYQYSNYAFSLLALVVENVAGETLEQYAQNRIFNPLGMTETSWFLSNLDTTTIAMPMWYEDPYYQAYGHSGSPLWPIAQVRTSATQLAQHVFSLSGYGEVNGNRVLDSTSVEEIKHVSFPGAFSGSIQLGLGWYSLEFASGTVWGHDGSMPGGSALMFFDPIRGTGVILLINTDYGDGLVALFNTLWPFSLDLDEDGIIAGYDNCDDTYNPDQIDINGNGVGDLCEGCCGFWTEGISGNANCSDDGKLTLSDITRLIDRVYISNDPLCCEATGNTNASVDCKLTLSDITVLIDAVYISQAQPADCMPECEM